MFMCLVWVVLCFASRVLSQLEFSQRLTQVNTGTDIGFGEAVAIGTNVNIAAISAAYGSVSKNVYIYKYSKSRNEWNLTQTINVCGTSLALSNNILVIGDSQARRAYVYKLDETDNNKTFVYVSTLSNGVSGGGFGSNCDVYVNNAYGSKSKYIILGDTSDETTGKSGGAYIFTENIDHGDSGWHLNQSVYALDEDVTWFGETVVISGNYAAVASWRGPSSQYYGYIYIYKLNAVRMVWDLIQIFEGAAQYYRLGFSMDMYIDENSGTSTGTLVASQNGVYNVNVYSLNSTGYFNYIQVLSSGLGDPSPTEFGYAISVYETRLAIGARGRYSNRGEVCFYESESVGDLFNFVSNITAYDASNNDRFGTDLMIGNTWLVVGTMDGEKAYIYGPNSTGNMEHLNVFFWFFF